MFTFQLLVQLLNQSFMIHHVLGHFSYSIFPNYFFLVNKCLRMNKSKATIVFKCSDFQLVLLYNVYAKYLFHKNKKKIEHL